MINLINIQLSKSDLGYGASIGFIVKGKERASLSFGSVSPAKAIEEALESIMYIAPNLTQEEIENNYEAYFSSSSSEKS